MRKTNLTISVLLIILFSIVSINFICFNNLSHNFDEKNTNHNYSNLNQNLKQISLMDDDDEEEDDNDDDLNDDEEDEEDNEDLPDNIDRTTLLYYLGIIGAVAVAVSYAIYELWKRFSAKNEREKLSKLFISDTIPTSLILSDKQSKSELVSMFSEENVIEKLSNFNKLDITFISPEFMERVDAFNWTGQEKEQFIHEMLSFTPEQRDQILSEMEQKSKILF